MLIIWYSLAGELEGATFDRFCLGIFSQMLFPTDFTEPTGDVLSKITDIKGLGEVYVLHVVTNGRLMKR